MIKKIFEKYYAELTGLTVFIVYLVTLAPTVVKIDSGELAAVQNTLGIAHPTGYPLFTLIGFIFQQIPLPFSPVYKSNLLSAIFCSAGTVVFVKAFHNLIISFFSIERAPAGKKEKKRKAQKSGKTDVVIKEVNKIFAVTASILGSLALAFSKTFWLQSTSVEVYSMQILVFGLLLLQISKILISQNAKQVETKDWILLSVYFAIGFSNHMTTLLFIPAAVILFFAQNSAEKFRLPVLIKIALVFTGIVFLSYSYLFLRASTQPLLNWGDPENLANLYRHVSGKQFSVWMFTGIAEAKKQFLYFFENIYTEFRLALLFISIIGLGLCIQRKNITSIILLVTFAFSVLFTINYDIVDIETYFLSAIIIACVWIGFAFYWLLGKLSDRKLNFRTSLIIIVFPLLFEFFLNFPEVDQSDNYFYEEYTKTVLGSVEENSIILSYQWDYLVSPSIYFQFCENFRKDIAVIDKELLRRSWYFNQINNAYDGIFEKQKDDIEAFKKELEPFEKGDIFDSQKLDYLFRKILTGIISENIEKRDIYIGPEFLSKELRSGELTLPEGFNLIPHLYLYKVVKTKSYIPAPVPEVKINYNKQDEYQKNACGFIFETMLNRAVYEHYNEFPQKANEYLRTAKNQFPEFEINPAIKNLLQNGER